MVALTGGLRAGDKVVLRPPQKLKGRGGRSHREKVARMHAHEGPIVEIRGLSKAYQRGGQVVPVLTDINLDIASGDFIALMGPSGSARARCSTSLRASTNPLAEACAWAD
jgi:ABC-type glutathione transport system ATPase component